jgi:hypothetical protein
VPEDQCGDLEVCGSDRFDVGFDVADLADQAIRLRVAVKP